MSLWVPSLAPPKKSFLLSFVKTATTITKNKGPDLFSTPERRENRALDKGRMGRQVEKA